MYLYLRCVCTHTLFLFLKFEYRIDSSFIHINRHIHNWLSCLPSASRWYYTHVVIFDRNWGLPLTDKSGTITLVVWCYIRKTPTFNLVHLCFHVQLTQVTLFVISIDSYVWHSYEMRVMSYLNVKTVLLQHVTALMCTRLTEHWCTEATLIRYSSTEYYSQTQ